MRDPAVHAPTRKKAKVTSLAQLGFFGLLLTQYAVFLLILAFVWLLFGFFGFFCFFLLFLALSGFFWHSTALCSSFPLFLVCPHHRLDCLVLGLRANTIEYPQLQRALRELPESSQRAPRELPVSSYFQALVKCVS
jgi:hypothetical protein